MAKISRQNSVHNRFSKKNGINCNRASSIVLNFIHMWRNFHFPRNCHTWKAEISPHDNFFSTNIICDIRDKYELWTHTTWSKNQTRQRAVHLRLVFFLGWLSKNHWGWWAKAEEEEGNIDSDLSEIEHNLPRNGNFQILSKSQRKSVWLIWTCLRDSVLLYRISVWWRSTFWRTRHATSGTGGTMSST